ncbi:MAG: SGNH/GDSL hydrolase family protein [Chloroflexi bacterium]|nr:SGNH/GDSL hydrolase family protein [Chloroflexota bacterium]
MTPTATLTETPTELPTLTETPTETPTEAQTPGLADTAPVVPNIGALQGNLRAIYDAGVSQGNRAPVVSFVGDETSPGLNTLAAFTVPGSAVLDDSSAGLQPIMDWYTQAAANDLGIFNRSSAALRSGWQAEDLLNPANSDASVCSAGETPLQCEIRLSRPAVMIISVGYNDVLQGTDPAQFRASLQNIIQTATGSGVIPVLTTVQPRPDAPAEQMRAINDAIIETADANNVPVLNLWRALNAVPNSGLNADNVTLSVAPGGTGDLTAAAVSGYGANARAFYLLTLLDALRTNIYPDAP